MPVEKNIQDISLNVVNNTNVFTFTFADGTTSTSTVAIPDIADGSVEVEKLAEDFVLPINKGGTGGNSVATALWDLGIYSLPLGVASGGTGANNASSALWNLGITERVWSISHGGTGETMAREAREALGIYLPLEISDGGTGEQTVEEAREALGINIPLEISDGGTGADNVADARDNLGIRLPLNVYYGGTGANSAEGARSLLGLSDLVHLPIAKGGTDGHTASEARSRIGISRLSPLAIAEGGTGEEHEVYARKELGLPLGIEYGGTGETNASRASDELIFEQMTIPLPTTQGGVGSMWSDMLYATKKRGGITEDTIMYVIDMPSHNMRQVFFVKERERVNGRVSFPIFTTYSEGNPPDTTTKTGWIIVNTDSAIVSPSFSTPVLTRPGGDPYYPVKVYNGQYSEDITSEMDLSSITVNKYKLGAL